MSASPLVILPNEKSDTSLKKSTDRISYNGKLLRKSMK